MLGSSTGVFPAELKESLAQLDVGGGNESEQENELENDLQSSSDEDASDSAMQHSAMKQMNEEPTTGVGLGTESEETHDSNEE